MMITKRQRYPQKHQQLMNSFVGEMCYRMFVIVIFATVVGTLVAIG